MINVRGFIVIAFVCAGWLAGAAHASGLLTREAVMQAFRQVAVVQGEHRIVVTVDVSRVP